MKEEFKSKPLSFYILIPFTIWAGFWIYGALASSKALLHNHTSIQEVTIFLFTLLMAFYNLSGLIGLWLAKYDEFFKSKDTPLFLLSLGVSSILINTAMTFFLFLTPISSWNFIDLNSFLYGTALAWAFSALCYLNYKFLLKA